MKIKEIIERYCCDPQKDLKPYQGKYKSDVKMYFCQQCGEHLVYEKYTDAAGSIDTKLVPVKPMLYNINEAFLKKKYTILRWVGNPNGIAEAGVRNWEECFSTDFLGDANAKMNQLVAEGVCAALYQDGVNIAINYERGVYTGFAIPVVDNIS